MAWTRFDHELALRHSAYSIPRGPEIFLEPSGSPAPDVAQFVHAQLVGLVLDLRFPCVAARSAVKNGAYRFGLYPEMATEPTTHGLLLDLRRFVADQDRMKDGFSTFFASFTGPNPASELDFEAVLWKQLQALHDLEAPVEAWDASVSADPDSPQWRMCLAGRAFYVVGLHAGSSRYARRFAWPTLIFNANFLFQRLQETNQAPKFRKVARTLDTRLQGDINPNVLTSEEGTVAREFSGRKAEDDWKCPFQPRVGPSADDEEGDA